MNTPLTIRTIDPLNVAAKLDAIRNFLLPHVAAEIQTEPRLVEALHFLQWISIPENYAGGLARFSQDLVARFADEVGPEVLLEARGAKLSDAQIETILSEFPCEVRDTLIPDRSDQLIAEVVDNWGPEEKAMERRQAAAERRKLTFSVLHGECLKQARENLANFLWAVCSVPEQSFYSETGPLAFLSSHQIWYFSRVWKCLFTWMDEHAASVRCNFAETTITTEIFRWLELASESGKGVMFIGHSRFGKSVAIRSYARMFPGKARIVECPSNSAESDLLREVARSLGIRFSNATTPLHEQRAAIDKVLRQGKFLLIFDEAQFLFPPSGKRIAVPPRLNYVRRSIMDIGIPTAFICTQQNWKHVQKSFLKASAYSIEQFEGRLLRSPVHLAAELSEAEMIEVARIHLPELDDDYLTVIVLKIRSFNTGDHLSSIDNIAIIARKYAGAAGRSVPTLNDVEQATDDVLGCNAVQARPDLEAAESKKLESPAPAVRRIPAVKPTDRSIRPSNFAAKPARRTSVLAIS